jgi:hypothetical protein
MTHSQLHTRRLSADDMRLRLRRALEKSGKPSGLSLRDLAAADMSIVRHVPEWVGQVGALGGEGMLCLWFEPRASSIETFPSQVVIDLPPGRYMIDTLDVGASTWYARESAAGGPLVAGLSRAGGPVLVVVTRTGDAAPTALLDQEDPQ